MDKEKKDELLKQGSKLYHEKTPEERKKANAAQYRKQKGKRAEIQNRKKAKSEAKLKKQKEDRKQEIAEMVKREKAKFPRTEA